MSKSDEDLVNDLCRASVNAEAIGIVPAMRVRQRVLMRLAKLREIEELADVLLVARSNLSGWPETRARLKAAIHDLKTIDRVTSEPIAEVDSIPRPGSP